MNQMKKMVSHVFIKYKMFQNARTVVGLGCHEREFVLRGIKDFNTLRYCA